MEGIFYLTIRRRAPKLTANQLLYFFELHMKRLDHDKVSLVEFLGSIKFAPHRHDAGLESAHLGHFARLNQQVRMVNREEQELVRSAN